MTHGFGSLSPWFLGFCFWVDGEMIYHSRNMAHAKLVTYASQEGEEREGREFLQVFFKVRPQ